MDFKAVWDIYYHTVLRVKQMGNKKSEQWHWLPERHPSSQRCADSCKVLALGGAGYMLSQDPLFDWWCPIKEVNLWISKPCKMDRCIPEIDYRRVGTPSSSMKTDENAQRHKKNSDFIAIHTVHQYWLWAALSTKSQILLHVPIIFA